MASQLPFSEAFATSTAWLQVAGAVLTEDIVNPHIITRSALASTTIEIHIPLYRQVTGPGTYSVPYMAKICASVIVEAQGMPATDPAGGTPRADAASGFIIMENTSKIWKKVDELSDQECAELLSEHKLPTGTHYRELLRIQKVMGYIHGLPSTSQEHLYNLLTLLTTVDFATPSGCAPTSQVWMTTKENSENKGILHVSPSCQLWALKRGPEPFFRAWLGGAKPDGKLLRDNSNGIEIKCMQWFGCRLEAWGWDCYAKGMGRPDYGRGDFLQYPPVFGDVDLWLFE